MGQKILDLIATIVADKRVAFVPPLKRPYVLEVLRRKLTEYAASLHKNWRGSKDSYLEHRNDEWRRPSFLHEMEKEAWYFLVKILRETEEGVLFDSFLQVFLSEEPL